MLMDDQSAQGVSTRVFVAGPDCTDRGCGLPPVAPSLSVTSPAPKRMLSRRSAFAIAAKTSALSLLAACSPKTAIGPATDGSPAAGQPGRAAGPASKSAVALQRRDLAFCSQLLCILPYEIARQRGFFADEGLNVNFVYMQGGAQAMNALVGMDTAALLHRCSPILFLFASPRAKT
jgi:hypothetical protein